MKKDQAQKINSSTQYLGLNVCLSARENYKVSSHFSGALGDNPGAIPELVKQINLIRKESSFPGSALRVCDLNAIFLITQVWEFLIRCYNKSQDALYGSRLEDCLQERLGNNELDLIREGYIKEFPPPAPRDPASYLKETRGQKPVRLLILEKILVLGLANRNPAFSPATDLFSDSVLEKIKGYPLLMEGYRQFLSRESGFGSGVKDLFSFLIEPILARPHSLSGQLDYIFSNWSYLLSEDLKQRLLVATDIIREEEKDRGPGPDGQALIAADKEAEELKWGGARGFLDDYEAFSPDLDWMPRVVLMVKNASVWLGQLSRKYSRRITRLDQIPDQELDDLKVRGFTGLWLIGLWAKCQASQLIKRLSGNPGSGPSAYSLYDYEISSELGGDKALKSLRERATQRGIRLGSDMVPNHTGIYSRWIVEHPEWFVQSPVLPFPGYSFTGPNLSRDPRVAVYIEDGYWTRRDAAVVFKRLDRLTGEVRYVYHGNDGTNMPWNDTAQLDYLKKEVREAVIETILKVARCFPIIRFDAAMVLTKKHFERLWYPPPGSGGDIPSRAGKGISPSQFNHFFPKEFWREVVDRVAKREPETLLLAEAFWLLEGYFVRTLGMHRVYNSAFMNMLKMEMNAQYRQMLKEFLEFEPQILKRFVNFMSNPDEATAAEGFGDGDKYFGVCTMMVTLPGLPLFSHGQVEGFREKYGMEFLEARMEEKVNQGLLERHYREIFPLLKKRYLFSDVTNFILYDFYDDSGRVNENIYAYSNRYRGERALVVYHNFYAQTDGWIRVSAARAEKHEGQKHLRQLDLGQALKLRSEPGDFTVFREQRSGLEYIYSSQDLQEKGLSLSLKAYEVKVFTDFRVIRDGPDQVLARLSHNLKGKGVARLDEEIKKLHFGPLHQSFRELFNSRRLSLLLGLVRIARSREELVLGLDQELLPFLEGFFHQIEHFSGGQGKKHLAPDLVDKLLNVLILFGDNPDLPRWESSRYSRPALLGLSKLPLQASSPLISLAIVMLTEILSVMGRRQDKDTVEVSRMKKWYLDGLVRELFVELGLGQAEAGDNLDLLRCLLTGKNRMGSIKTKNHLYLLVDYFREDPVRRYLRYHWYEDILWLNKESLENLLHWLFNLAALDRAFLLDQKEAPRVKGLVLFKASSRLLGLAEESCWQVESFISGLSRCRYPRRKKKSRKKKADFSSNMIKTKKVRTKKDRGKRV